MSIYGYNFNAIGAVSDLTLRGWMSTGEGISTSIGLLSWNNKSLQVGYTSAIPPALNTVDTVRVKCCVTCTAGNSAYAEPIVGVWNDSVVIQCYVARVNNGAIALYRGNTLIAITTKTELVNYNTPFNIELYCCVNETNGFCKVYLNGSILDDLSFTGNTLNSGSVNIKYAGVPASTDAASQYRAFVHDIIIDDAPTDTIIGNRYAMTLRPNGTVSKTSGVSTSDGTDPATVLAQTAPNGTPYVELSNSGDSLTLSFGDLSSTVTDVIAVSVNADISKSGAGSANARLDVTINGTMTQGADTSLPNGFVGVSTLSGAELSVSGINAMTVTLNNTTSS